MFSCRDYRPTDRLVIAMALMAALLAIDACFANGGSTRFWLSTSASAPPGPEAPTVTLPSGGVDTLYVWVRPETGKKVRNVSLNLVADATGVDFADGSYTIFNSVTLTVDRFEFVHDSFSSPALTSDESLADVAAGQVDRLPAIQGFKIGSNPNIRGVGPGCLSSDTLCFDASDGMPAWLFGEVDINATAVGTVNLHLQIGDVGINHETVAAGDYNYDGTVNVGDFAQWVADFGSMVLLSADGNRSGTVDAADYTVWRDNQGASGMVEMAALAEVVFGVDTMDGIDEPMHNGATDRSINLAMDDPDAVIVITAPAVAASHGVPEPGTIALVAIGLGCVCGRSRRGRPIKKAGRGPTGQWRTRFGRRP